MDFDRIEFLAQICAEKVLCRVAIGSKQNSIGSSLSLALRAPLRGVQIGNPADL